MTAPIVDRVKEHLRTISLRRHQLILICENFGQSHVQMVAEAFNFPYIHLSLQVSQQLKDIPFKERPRKVFQTVQHLLKQQRSSVICLDHIELLFHPSLKQNPVTLFEHLSRNYVLIVSWKGTVRDGVLTYAKPEHPEYVHTKAFDAVVIHAAEGGETFVKYSELVQFEPIESVIQLTDADEKDYAFHLIDTYVISDRMAEVLDELVLEQLQFVRPADNKGLLIVGNYGTGKSHLMSVISTIAEREGACAHLNNDRIARKAKDIEGKFKVIRLEIGSVQTSLRDILCGALEEGLEKMGVSFSFLPVDQVTNNKDAFIEMMAAFHEQYPDDGLLLVVDELLDYLKSRREQELFLDLNFLREVGEICNKTKFRFIAGIQEMLFDNPRFQFVAEQLRRVRERFEQIRIVREDIAFVVSERLLKKDDRQKALIREHLQKFTQLYDRLSEDMEQFVNLFPIHPAYLSTFEKVVVAEKRVILKTLSHEIKKMMDADVPTDEPGFISFDSYWPYIIGDPSLKSDPNIKEVTSKAAMLQDRIDHAFTKPLYKPLARRIVNALAVFRLTADDIYAPIGLTAEELRDSLFLYVPLLDESDPADFLKTTVEAVLREIQKTVSYQYISANEANGQYYIDIKKDIAVDEMIDQKAETLGDDQLDRYYFDVLKRAMEMADASYVTGYHIWAHRLPWHKRKVMREGYIFFGAPNERSTAQPPQDFYIYMLQPFAPPKYKDEERPDEVFFRLIEKDDTFLRALKLYAGAQEMAAITASGTKKLYVQKAEVYLKELVKWLKDNGLQCFEVTYKGRKDLVSKFTMFMPPQATIQEMIDAVSAECLSDWFEEKYPDYPSFKNCQTPLTRDNLETYVRDALKQISGTNTRQGRAILDGLVLLEGDQLNVRRSGFARWVIDQLDAKAQGQVVNQSELIETVYTGQGTEHIQQMSRFKLEPELFVVILAALVYSGEIVMTVNGKTYDAMNYDKLIQLPLRDLVHFSHIKKPSGLPMAELTAIFEMLDISRGFLQSSALPFGIRELIKEAQKLVNELAVFTRDVQNGFPLSEEAVLAQDEIKAYVAQLSRLQTFLEDVQIYDTPAKWHNFRYSKGDIDQFQGILRTFHQLKALKQQVNDCAKLVHYIDSARHQLLQEHAWQQRAQQLIHQLIVALKQGRGAQAEMRALEQLKAEYIDQYMRWHAQARLNATDDNQKDALSRDKRWLALNELANIDFFSEQPLKQWMNRLNALKACWKLTKEDLAQRPVCPYCHFVPREETYAQSIRLEALDDELDNLLNQWTATVVTNLNVPAVQESVRLLHEEEQKRIKHFLQRQAFDLPVDPVFIQTIKEVLAGIDKVEITTSQFIRAMGNGTPLTIDEVKLRFDQLLKEQVGHRPANNVRIILQQ